MLVAEQSLRQYCLTRLAGMDTDRRSWFIHWGELATFLLPRRYRWFVTPNQASRGNPINNAILDNTGTMAARVLASGMMSGITSPTRPWFQLRIEGFDTDTTNPVNLWLAEVRRRIMRVMQESNFYNSLGVAYLDLGVFGTASMIIYEDYEDIIRCYNPCLGEFYLASNDRLQVDTLARKFVLTIAQTVQWFGINRVSATVRDTYNSGQLSQELTICHIIEPNNTLQNYVPKEFPYREIYWEESSNEDKTLLERGFYEFPALCPRWDIVANDTYGRSPGMDALGDIKQLQQETKRKAQAIDKMVNPPLVADMRLKNQPSTTIPGGITYVDGLNNGGASAGMRPLYTLLPPIQELKEDIAEIQARVRNTFFNDLFLMISQLDTVRTATEIDARREEKLVQLGPVLERFENECLDPAINRIFNILLRAQLLPPPPPEIQGAQMQISYNSMLAEVQRAVGATGIERLLTLTGSIAGISPEILDNLDLDEVIDEYASLLNVDPRLVRSRKDLAALREARAQEEEEAKAMALTAEGVNAAKTLSETSVGGGQTALTQMLSGQGLPGASPI